MKNWFAAAGRFCLDFILFLALIAFSLALIRSSGRATAGEFLGALAREGRSCYIPAAVAALFLASYGFERKLRKPWAIWLSLFCLTLALLAGGGAARRLQALSQAPVEAPGLAQATEASRSEGVAIERDYDASGLGMRMLASYGPGLEKSLQQRLTELDALPALLALASLAGFTLLAVGLAAFSRIPRWELVGFFFSGAGFLLLFLIDGLIASPGISNRLLRLGAGLGLPRTAIQLGTAIVEAILGLVFLSCALVSRRRQAS